MSAPDHDVKCATCKFFVRDERPKNKENGRCHRFPPTLTFGPFSYSGDSDWNQDRPYMVGTDFCGEWHPQ